MSSIHLRAVVFFCIRVFKTLCFTLFFSEYYNAQLNSVVPMVIMMTGTIGNDILVDDNENRNGI